MTSMVSAAEAMGAEIDGGRQIVRADLPGNLKLDQTDPTSG